MDQLTDYFRVVNGVISSYFSKEGIPNDDSFSKITVNLLKSKDTVVDTHFLTILKFNFEKIT